MKFETQPVATAGLYAELPASTDVVIVGGGPAGAATALALRRIAPRLSVTLVDVVGPRRFRTGILDRDVQPLLARLGIWEDFLRSSPPPTRGTHAAWGSERLSPHEFFFAAPRQGWRIDRQGFATLMRLVAASEDVCLTRALCLVDATLTDGGEMRVELERDGGRQAIRARFAVDATGRQARLALLLGARKVRFDRLVGAFVVLPSTVKAFDEADVFVEARPQGWWYTIRETPESALVGFLTDADLARTSGAGEAARWRELFRATESAGHLGDAADASAPEIHAAHSQHLEPTAGVGWLAVGDAACTVDPLTMPGIRKALGSGIEAAQAIADHLAGRSTGLRRYRHGVASGFESFLESRRKIYEREARFADELFWERRSERLVLDPEILLSYDETPGKTARLAGLDMHLPVDDLQLLCTLCVSPRLSRAVVKAFQERRGSSTSRRRILLALQYLVEQGLITAE